MGPTVRVITNNDHNGIFRGTLQIQVRQTPFNHLHIATLWSIPWKLARRRTTCKFSRYWSQCSNVNYFCFCCGFPIAGLDNADIDSFICHMNLFQLQGNIPSEQFLLGKHNPVLVALSKCFMTSKCCVLVDVFNMIIKTFFPLNSHSLWLNPRWNSAWQGYILAHVTIDIFSWFVCKISWKKSISLYNILQVKTVRFYSIFMCDAETVPPQARYRCS